MMMFFCDVLCYRREERRVGEKGRKEKENKRVAKGVKR